MDLLYIVNEFILVIIEALFVLTLHLSLTGKRNFISENKFQSVLIVTLYVIITYWSRNYLPVALHTIFIAAFIVVTLSYFTKTKIYICAISVLLFFILLSIVEICVLIPEMLILKTSMEQIASTPNFRLVGSIASKTIELIFIVALTRKEYKIFRTGIIENKDTTYIYIMFQMFLIGVLVLSFSQISTAKSNIMFLNLMLVIIYILLLLINFFDFKERQKILRIQSKFQTQEEHVKNLETVIDFIRREKHDFANHLNTIHIMGKLDKPDSLARIVDYTTKLTHDLGTSYQFYNTGNDYIDGLLAVKSNAAHEKGITMEVNFEAPLSQVEVSDSDLTSIVGNIVDNAFEAVSRRAGAQSKVVSISSYVEGDKYYLTIANNGPMIPEKTLEKIFESGFSTKTDNKADHGYGLYIVKQMVERNGGEVTVVSTEDETVFEIGVGIRSSKIGESA